MGQSRRRASERCSAASDSMFLNLRPKRTSRVPANLKDMVYAKKKTIQHVKLGNKKGCDLERRSNDDSGYEEDDRASSSSQQSFTQQDDFINNDVELESIGDGPDRVRRVAKESNSCNKVAIVRPLCVAEADEKDVDPAKFYNDVSKTKNTNKKVGGSNRRRSEPTQTANVRANCDESRPQSQTHSTKRLLMKEWILLHLREQTFPGLKWYDEQKMLCQITWKHRSANAWSRDDVILFESWAIHTGRHESDRDFKRWKANFRCALNILPDIEEVVQLRNPKGKNPFKVYHILNQGIRSKRTKSCSSGNSSSTTKRNRQESVQEVEQVEQDCYTDEVQAAVKQIQDDPLVPTAGSSCYEIDFGLRQTIENFNPSGFITISSSMDNLMLQDWSQPTDDTVMDNVSLSSALKGLRKNGSDPIASGSTLTLPSFTTLLNPFNTPEQMCLQDSPLCTPTESLFDIFSSNEPLYGSFSTPEPVSIAEGDLFSQTYIHLGDLERNNFAGLQTFSPLQNTYEFQSSTTTSSSTLPLMVEKYNSEC